MVMRPRLARYPDAPRYTARSIGCRWLVVGWCAEFGQWAALGGVVWWMTH